jgi:hypothetical protein
MAAEARTEAKAGRWAEALRLFEDALDADPRPEYLHEIAIVYLTGLNRPLKAREYAMRFAAAGRTQADLAVATTLLGECEKALATSHGRVRVELEPASAQAWVDDRIPEARVEGDWAWAAPGRHKLIVEALDRETRVEPFDVTAGAEVRIKVVLAVRKAEIRAECTVPACSLSFNGERVEPGPRQVAAGTWRIRAEAEGFFPAEETVTLRPGEARVTRLTPTPMPQGNLVVRCDVAPCLVFLDGDRLGEAPIQVSMRPGSHVIRAVSDGHVAYEQRVASKAEGDVFVTAILPVIHKAGPGPGNLRTWAWVAIGAGGAMLATGAVLVGLGYRDAGAADDLHQKGYPTYAAYRSAFDDKARSARIKAYTGWALLGVGIAAAGTGIVLYSTSPAGPVATTLAPAVLPGGGGVAATASW